MGLFSKKQKEAKVTTFLVLPKELLYLVDLAIKAIDSWQIEYEIEFKIGEVTHQIGIDYDRTKAPKKGYSPEYMSVFLDEQKFVSLNELWENTLIDGNHFNLLGREIELDIIYKEPLETGDIETYYETL